MFDSMEIANLITPSASALCVDVWRQSELRLDSFHSFCTIVTWLILPVVICLSQRLSHACLSINNFILWNCVQLIISAIIYLMVSCYMDNRGNSRANTCVKTKLLRGWLYLLDKNQWPSGLFWWIIITVRIDRLRSAIVHSNFCPIRLRW